MQFSRCLSSLETCPNSLTTEQCAHAGVSDDEAMAASSATHGVSSQLIEPVLGIRRSQKLLRKEVIQPHVPVRLPCYDFIPITDPTFGSSLPCGLGH
jgi:hypothetical protein